MNITPDPKNDMKIGNTQCTMTYTSCIDPLDPTFGLSTVNATPTWFNGYLWQSNDINSPQYCGILYSDKIFLEKLTFYGGDDNINVILKNWYVEIVDKDNNWAKICEGLNPNSISVLNTADINKFCYGFRIVCLDGYYTRRYRWKGFRCLTVYGEIIHHKTLYTDDNNIYAIPNT